MNLAIRVCLSLALVSIFNFAIFLLFPQLFLDKLSSCSPEEPPLSPPCSLIHLEFSPETTSFLPSHYV